MLASLASLDLQAINPLATSSLVHPLGERKCQEVHQSHGIWGPCCWLQLYQVCALVPNQHQDAALRLCTALLTAPWSGTGINHQPLPGTQKGCMPGFGRASGRAPCWPLCCNRSHNRAWRGVETKNKPWSKMLNSPLVYIPRLCCIPIAPVKCWAVCQVHTDFSTVMSGASSLANTRCREGSRPDPKPGTALQKNPAHINNIWNLCPLLSLHYGSFVGFSLGFNEATVSRKRETLRSRGSVTADIEVKKYLTSVLLQLLLAFTEKSKTDALFTVPIVLFTVPSSISCSYSHFSPLIY